MTNSTHSWSLDQLFRTLDAVAYVSAADRREQLIEATIAVLRRSGAEGVTTRAVAAEAGAPLASIHYTFGSLDDLVVAAFERLIDEVSQHIADGLDVAAGYGPCIVAVMQRVAGLLDDERFGVLLRDLNPTGDRRVEALEVRYYRLAHDLVDAIAAARRREPAVPRAQLARLIMAAIDGVVLQFAASGDVDTACDDLAAFGTILAAAADRRR
jgi:AcrR family transcriptional regulator